jgi:DNA-binding response OmpR family regulator
MGTRKPYKVLVVDDEPDVVVYLRTFLEDHGFEVKVANNGKTGYDETLAWKPDLISLDITMPEESGIRMYRDVRENPETAPIPVIIVTGVSPLFEKFIGTRKQVPPPNAYFEKPIDKDAYLAKLKELVGQEVA